MKTLDQWLSEYGESHQNTTNRLIHKICVPAITWSLLALLWKIPNFGMPELANFASLFVLICFAFYLTLRSFKVMGIFFILLGPIFLSLYLLRDYPYLWQTALTVFVIAWIGQFIGHKIEGKKPSFFKDLQFLLIGPLWIFIGK
ncbi:DUF962 domain-containing protein [Halobacteriovorax sp. GB3]|uniref:Mpo1 family 2-hydroxy fatty acid dioxygenase n=1 Tax=Halobacteriovorax sp. GB3 TaxID=2719615 RepID=UPI0023611D43|nr:Mpo1-like protein [Halobacteriovorax sp. GB3]MDD0852072.1 DUF962 domain-containing protein [Halobacteriovorax sp. GB3]